MHVQGMRPSLQQGVELGSHSFNKTLVLARLIKKFMAQCCLQPFNSCGSAFSVRLRAFHGPRQ